MRFLLLSTVTLAWLAGQPLMPWKELKTGMKGTGRTVFEGGTVASFGVEVLGVLENSGPGQALILARLSGGPLERTGVMQGMSGSPVYFNGRLAGAVAFAFPYAKEPIAGIRPIEEMLRAADPVPGPVQRASAKFGDTELVEMATPMSLSGFTPRTVENFRDDLRRLGFEPRQGVSSGSPASPAMGDPRRLQPGSMISVQLMTGDLSIGADGTVTHIDGNRLYAFGHRFLSLGDTEMPFARAEVVTLMPTLATSFKISNPREWMGAITTDRNTAVGGVLGRQAKMTPLTLSVASVANGRPRAQTYKMEMVNHRVLAPFLTQLAVFSALDATERSLGAMTVGLEGEAKFTGADIPPLRFRNLFAGDFNTALPAAMSVASPLSALLEAAVPGLKLERIDLRLSVKNERRQLRIDNAWLSRTEAAPGDAVEISIALAGDDGAVETRKLPWRVPAGIEPGALTLSVTDAAGVNLQEARRLYAGGSLAGKTPAQFVELLNSLQGNTKVLVRITSARSPVTVGPVELANLPSSASTILKSPAPLSAPLPGGGARIADLEIDLLDRVVSGAKALTLTVTP